MVLKNHLLKRRNCEAAAWDSSCSRAFSWRKLITSLSSSSRSRFSYDNNKTPTPSSNGWYSRKLSKLVPKWQNVVNLNDEGGRRANWNSNTWKTPVRSLQPECQCLVAFYVLDALPAPLTNNVKVLDSGHIPIIIRGCVTLDARMRWSY